MAVEKPDRDTAFGALCAFDDKSEGFLSISTLQGIWGMGDTALKEDELAALMLELNAGIAENGKVTIDKLLEFLYSEEPTKFTPDADLTTKQMDIAIKLGGDTAVSGGKKK
eukprot:TRINITY_DN3654_c0_g1_i1.p4 TRINITY_DN3654_c0_g1~~TRINITY_DN3654_c0_g1_i1.p4  ORF type:complete len:111 (+),score=48.85 TRINITY_DN3654_c0_g1_i1:57-389(+)